MAYTDLLKPDLRRDFQDRHPNAVLWLVAAGQAVAMLGINLLLRWLVL